MDKFEEHRTELSFAARNAPRTWRVVVCGDRGATDIVQVVAPAMDIDGGTLYFHEYSDGGDRWNEEIVEAFAPGTWLRASLCVSEAPPAKK